MKTSEIQVGKVYAVQRDRQPTLYAGAFLILSTETHSSGRKFRDEDPVIKRGKGGFNATVGVLGVNLDRVYGTEEVPEVPTFTPEQIEQGRITGRIPKEGGETENGGSYYSLRVIPPRQVHGEFGPLMARLRAEQQQRQQSRDAEEARKEAGRARQHAAIDRVREALPEAFPTPEPEAYDRLKDRHGDGSTVTLSIAQFEALVAAARSNP